MIDRPSFKSRLAKTFAAAIVACRPAGGYIRLAYPGVPIGLCLAAIATMGPSLQHYVLTAATGEAASIYAAAYQEDIVRLPDFPAWLINAGGIPYAVAGFLAGLLAAGRRTVVATAIAAGARFFLLTGAIDVVIALAGLAPGAPALATNLFANLAGAAIATGLLLVGLALATKARLVSHKRSERALVQSATLLMTGVVGAGLAFLGFGTLYRPLPAWMEVVAGLPFRGMAVYDDRRSTVDREGFDWLPARGAIGKLSAMSVRGPLVARWVPANGDGWRMSLDFFARCMGEPAKLAASRDGPAFDLDRGLTMESTGDLTMVETDRHASIAVRPDIKSTMFTLEAGRGARGPTITNLTGGKVVARIEPFETAGVAFATSLFLPGTRRTAPQTFRIKGRRGTTEIVLRPMGSDIERDTCTRAVPKKQPAGAEGVRRYVVDVDGAMVTALATFSRSSPPPLSLYAPSSRLELSGLSAWTEVSAIDPTMLGAIPQEKVSELLFDGAITEFTLDGQPVDAKARNNFWAKGSIEGEWLDGGHVRLSGRVDQLWRDGRRLNETRWEKATNEMQIFLLGAVGTLLLFAARLLWPVITSTKDVMVEF